MSEKTPMSEDISSKAGDDVNWLRGEVYFVEGEDFTSGEGEDGISVHFLGPEDVYVTATVINDGEFSFTFPNLIAGDYSMNVYLDNWGYANRQYITNELKVMSISLSEVS
jgi:hypothetical protein